MKISNCTASILKIEIKDKVFAFLPSLRIYISSDGTIAFDEDAEQLEIETDPEGYKYVEDCWFNPRVADVLALAWIERPDYKTPYFVEHIDGNKDNYDISNLSWKAVEPGIITTAKCVFWNDFIIFEDSSIIVGANDTEAGFLTVDRDTNLVWSYETAHISFVEPGNDFWTDMSVDELMARAGYVHGNPKDFNNPVVFHRDQKSINCESDNLEWTESNDPKYVSYMEKNKKEQIQRIKDSNKGNEKYIADFWGIK